MGRDQLRSSLIVHVRTGPAGRRIIVHDLRTRETHEFASWAEFVDYAQALAPPRALR